ncbi:Na(+)/H(+) antiporter subunit C [Micrococcoides hystricis]|uniref:Na(+)/H(+) antiporter subunit C n=1 Tax=Micrococcoides hystricis TaxID=1572761 RepID=A0ABV6PCW2_9MICC
MTINITLLLVMAVLYAIGVYLVTERSLTRILLGMMLITNATNLLILATGGLAGLAPIVTGEASADVDRYNDPLPQAMMLTAIVISFAVTAFFVALIYRAWVISRQDEVEDDDEDKRVASQPIYDAEDDAELQAETSEFGADPNVDYELTQREQARREALAGPRAIGASEQLIPFDADESPGSHRRDNKVVHRKPRGHRKGEF